MVHIYDFGAKFQILFIRKFWRENSNFFSDQIFRRKISNLYCLTLEDGRILARKLDFFLNNILAQNFKSFLFKNFGVEIQFFFRWKFLVQNFKYFCLTLQDGEFWGKNSKKFSDTYFGAKFQTFIVQQCKMVKFGANINFFFLNQYFGEFELI